MVNLVRHDLEFILKQIKIAEAHSAGTPLTAIRIDASGNITTDPNAPLAIPTPLSPYGLRTVDGSYNNLVEGRDQWGAADMPFPRITNPVYRNEADDSITFGAGTSNEVTFTDGNYAEMGAPSPQSQGLGGGTVVDADPRIISNLIVDQTLENPAAIYAALTHAGVSGAAITPALAEIRTAYTSLKNAIQAENDTLKPGSTSTDKEKADATAARKEAEGKLGDTLGKHGVQMEGNTVVLPNVAPDEGLSAPYNGWFTLFGQFFDHGLDLVTKGNNGTVYIPLQPDDPLYNPATPHTNFMVLTRAPAEPQNLTTPWVDQNQTYTSHSSHQLFLREYEFSVASEVGGPLDSHPVSTGKLLEGSRGLATWADVKAQARTKLGIDLTDADVTNIPLFVMDEYGEFVRGPNGLPQLVKSLGADGKFGGGDDVFVEGDLANPISTAGSVRTGHAFLDDIAHAAVPVVVNGVLQTDSDSVVGYSGGLTMRGTHTHYDNELLDTHYVTGDGRGNENIGLSAVHHIFHSEHNHTVEQLKIRAIEAGDLAFLNEWLRVDLSAGTALPPANDTEAVKTFAATLSWDGERLFQAARFTTEMQYQHLVFEEFARKVQPDVDAFVFNPSVDINPNILAEFAHVVYRFGHSMLRETVDRVNPDGTRADMDLFDAFLNPLAFGSATVDHEAAAGAIVRGMTSQVGNEIDEFVTHVLRNQLVGIPLDLAALNIARGRDTGIPSLNEARRQFKEAANGDTQLDPYTSWTDFALNLKNPASIVNFIAAYGTHTTITTATTAAAKRDAAMALVFGGADAPADREAFLNGTGAYKSSLGGLNDVDLWVGGMAEKKMAFGGMLGSTFSFIFELQMENLQNGDRFYYLSRVQGLNFLNELENNSFAKMVLNNTDLGKTGYALPGDIFSVPDHVLYMDRAMQGKFGELDPVQADPFLEAVSPLVQRIDADGDGVDEYIRVNTNDHVLIQGTNGNDTIIAGGGDDAVWGRDGNDNIEAGYGVDKIHGGKGDDIITNSGTDIGEVDMLHGEEGNDVIHAGSGLALVFGNEGQDFIITGPDGKEAFGGTGNDFILGGEGDDFLLGNEGDDWIEAGNGFDTSAGDNSELNFNSSIIGHDVMFAGQNEHDFDAESGDDIMVQGESVMRNEGMHGYDWAIYKGSQKAADADLTKPIFTTDEQDILRNRFDQVEALSGWEKNDVLRGDNRTAGGNGEPVPGVVDETGFKNNELSQAGVDRINGLRELLGTLVPDKPTSGNLEAAIAFQGNILLGGGGSDLIEGRGGDDLINGDMWLNVRIGIYDKDNNLIGSAEGMTSKVVDAGGNALYSGRSLSSLMLDRTLNPGQLGIIREILDGNKAGDIDTAVFSGNRSDYSITRLDTVTLRVVDNRGIDSSERGDVVSRIESFKFANGTFTFDELANRPPVILNNDGAPLTLTVSENTAADSTVLQLAAVDPDGIGTLSWSISSGNENGLFAIDSATGLIRLTVSPNYEDLAASGTTSQTLIVTVSDGQLSAAQQITINIADVNEAPIVEGPLAASATEGGLVVMANALAGASDPDAGTVLSVVGLPSVLPDGVRFDAGTNTFSLDPTAAAYDDLAAGQTRQVTVNYGVSDGTLTTPQTLVFTVTGTNDVPVAAVADITSGAVVEDRTTEAAGSFTFVDVDLLDSHSLSVSALADALGTVEVAVAEGNDGDGQGSISWNYSVNNAALQYLKEGEQKVETFAVSINDGQGGIAEKIVTINLTGAADQAVFAGAVGGVVREDGVAETGSVISVTDADAGEGGFLAAAAEDLVGSYGNFTFDAAVGRWGYVLDNSRSEVQALHAGQTVTDSLVVHSIDGTAQTITVTVMGSHDAGVNSLFDANFYLAMNPDVAASGMDAYQHFQLFGWKDGRDPNAFFDTSGYLAANRDVELAGINPLQHFQAHGWKEGRDPSLGFDTERYLAANPDVAAAGINPLEHYLTYGQAEGRAAFTSIGSQLADGFDRQFYLMANPDVAAARVDPLQHFRAHGNAEGRDPNGFFDTAGYRATYLPGDTDINALDHYMTVGWTLGYDPSAEFDTSKYLTSYADVAAAGMNPLEHYLRYGAVEGRQAFADGILD